MASPIRIGTRGSQLALCQARQVQVGLAAMGQPAELVIIQTTGDLNRTAALSEIGGKGVFIRELEQALLDGRIDLAVHSLKDVTSKPHEGLSVSGFLSPESICDCLVSLAGYCLDTLPPNAKIGTGSLRRKLWLEQLVPGCRIEAIRGNVETRLDHLQKLGLDAVVLSEAGLIRLGLVSCSKSGAQPFELNNQRLVSVRLEPEMFCPAPGQGVVAIEVRETDACIQQLIAQLSDPVQTIQSELELILLQALGFDCGVPFGARVAVVSEKVTLHAAWVKEAKLEQAQWHCSLSKGYAMVPKWAVELQLKMGI